MGDWFDALAESISGLAQTEFVVEDDSPTFRWDSSHALQYAAVEEVGFEECTK